MPEFFVNWKIKNAAYRQNQVGEKCFSFHSEYITPDVVAHEYTHAVVAAIVGTGGLGNAGEAGALNESVADVFAAVFARSNYTKEDWTIHDRDLSAHFGQSQILDTRPSENNDSGNIHHNSRLVSYGFVLSSAKLQEKWQFRRDEAEMSLLKIWWTAIEELNPGERTLAGFARKTVEIAGRGKGEGGIRPEAETLNAVWRSIWQS